MAVMIKMVTSVRGCLFVVSGGEMHRDPFEERVGGVIASTLWPGGEEEDGEAN